MASFQNYGFPYFSPPPPYYSQPPSNVVPTPAMKPPRRFSPPPPPNVVPTPQTPTAKPPRRSSPPPPSHIVPSPPTRYSPPPPYHPLAPPPPHIIPPPPAPPSENHTTFIVVFVSLGGLFFLAFLSVALCCFIKKKRKIVQKTEILNVDEHLKVQEAIMPGPHGTETVILSVEEDIHIQEVIKKNETVGQGLHGRSVNGDEDLHAKSVEIGESSSGPSHQLIEPKN
ncbi:hypothetical protein GIB67_018341 [Kingdonia uniflora]|uniref:Uncharacterized protein n=1 Tax=Kingdonia uniflora TaxID=39325 RepID=A0A7J7MJE5_9MAGN|nr:hypothetical protein GIB67_018341 [Kingdonia uniflora]